MKKLNTLDYQMLYYTFAYNMATASEAVLGLKTAKK